MGRTAGETVEVNQFTTDLASVPGRGFKPRYFVVISSRKGTYFMSIALDNLGDSSTGPFSAGPARIAAPRSEATLSGRNAASKRCQILGTSPGQPCLTQGFQGNR